MRTIENLQAEFRYWKELRDWAVSQPYSDKMAKMALSLVIEKMESIRNEAKETVGFIKFTYEGGDKGFDWSSER